MEHAQFQGTVPKTLREINVLLFALRDSLVELSLLLRDLQFELDQDERDKVDAESRALFEKMRSNRGSGVIGPS